MLNTFKLFLTKYVVTIKLAELLEGDSAVSVPGVSTTVGHPEAEIAIIEISAAHPTLPDIVTAISPLHQARLLKRLLGVGCTYHEIVLCSH